MSGALVDIQSQQYQNDALKCEDTQENENVDKGGFAVLILPKNWHENWTNSSQLQNREDLKCKIAIEINGLGLSAATSLHVCIRWFTFIFS